MHHWQQFRKLVLDVPSRISSSGDSFPQEQPNSQVSPQSSAAFGKESPRLPVCARALSLSLPPSLSPSPLFLCIAALCTLFKRARARVYVCVVYRVKRVSRCNGVLSRAMGAFPSPTYTHVYKKQNSLSRSVHFPLPCHVRSPSLLPFPVVHLFLLVASSSSIAIKDTVKINSR